jgi:hypothetical protein
LRQEDWKFKASLGYIVKLCYQKKKKKRSHSWILVVRTPISATPSHTHTLGLLFIWERKEQNSSYKGRKRELCMREERRKQENKRKNSLKN